MEAGRDRRTGQFAVGNRAAASENRKPTLDAVLKAEMPFEWLVGQLKRIAGTPGRDQLAAVRYSMDRIAGMPRQMLTVGLDDESETVQLWRAIWAELAGVKESAAVEAEYKELEEGKG